MQNTSDKDLEHIFKELAESADMPFDEAAWDKMEAKLDKEGRKRGYFYFRRFSLLLLLLVSVSSLLYVISRNTTWQAEEQRTDSLIKPEGNVHAMNDESNISSNVAVTGEISETLSPVESSKELSSEAGIVPQKTKASDDAASSSKHKVNEYAETSARITSIAAIHKTRSRAQYLTSPTEHSDKVKGHTSVDFDNNKASLYGESESLPGEQSADTKNTRSKDTAKIVNNLLDHSEYGEKLNPVLPKARKMVKGNDKLVNAGKESLIANKEKSEMKASAHHTSADHTVDSNDSSSADYLYGKPGFHHSYSKTEISLKDLRSGIDDGKEEELKNDLLNLLTADSGNVRPGSNTSTDIIKTVQHVDNGPVGLSDTADGNIYIVGGRPLSKDVITRVLNRAEKMYAGTAEEKNVTGTSPVKAGIDSTDVLSRKDSAALKKDSLVPAIKDSVHATGKKKSERSEGSKRFIAGLMLSPDFSSVGFFKFERPGIALGLNVEYKLSERIGILSGAILSTKLYTSKGGYDSEGGYWKFKNKPDRIDGSCTVLDIPVNVKYYLLSKGANFISATTGLSSYFMLHEKYTFVYLATGKNFSWKHINKNRYYFGVLNLSAAYERQLSRLLSIQAEPFAKVPLKKVGEGKVSLISMGMFVHLRYAIR